MPFTLSHPAAVVPLARWRWLHFPSLVLGSLAPDCGYYVPALRHFRSNSHSLMGSLTFCLPVAVALLLVCELLRPAFVFALPEPPRTALDARGSLVDGRRPGALLVSFVVGIWSHIVWDSFTHPTGRVVQALPVLQRIIVGDVPVYSVLQLLSSGIGLLVVFRACRPLPPLRVGKGWRTKFWASVGAGAIAAAYCFCGRLDGWATFKEVRESVVALTIVATSGALAALVLGLAALTLSRAVRACPPGPPGPSRPRRRAPRQ